MSSNPIRLQLLLHKYISNTASPEELEAFWKLMSELSDNDLIQLDLENVWNQKLDGNPAAGVDWIKAYHLLQQKIDNQEFDYERRIHSIRRRQYAYAGTAVVLLLCIGALVWKLSFNTVAPASKANKAAVAKSGRHQTISLPDGTMVTLNEGSKLDYPALFNQSSRDVYLTGEAFFDVKHDEAKPFLVHTGRFTTTVLGTAFNIRAYPGDADVAVTVTRGKVQVQSDGNKRTLGVLLAGDQLVIDKVSADVSLIKANVQRVVEWKATDMIFDNATVDEAAIALGNRYGATFLFKNEALRKCRFTADFANDSIDQSLDVICALINAHWEKKEGTNIIVLDGKGCGREE